MEVRRIPNNWEPRDYQLPLWTYLEGGGTRAVAVWHRRAGKDDVALHWTAVAANDVGGPESIGRVGNYWHMLPKANQARKALWDAVNPHTGKKRIDEAFPLWTRKATRNNDMLIEFNSGSTWQVVGSDNYDALVGSPPIGIVFSEWALADPHAWAYLRPILQENGGWAVFIYTPRGRNHGATTYENAAASDDWFGQRLPANKTSVFTPRQLALEHNEYVNEYGPDDGESRFEQEYMCDFSAAVVGSYYGTLMNNAEDDGRIGNVPHDPSIGVETWWDLGIGDPTAIWFVQRSGLEYRVINYYENNNVGIDHYAAKLQEFQGLHGYTYSFDVLPHDAEGRSLQTGKSLKDALEALTGRTPHVVPLSDINAGIQATRKIIPMAWFDKEKCERGLMCMREYRKEYDEKTKAFRDKPFHDWTSHGADAFRCGAMFDPDAVKSWGDSDDAAWGQFDTPAPVLPIA